MRFALLPALLLSLLGADAALGQAAPTLESVEAQLKAKREQAVRAAQQERDAEAARQAESRRGLEAERADARRTAEAPRGMEQRPASNGRDAGWAVQLGVFASSATAWELVDRLERGGIATYVEPVALANVSALRVRVGPVAQEARARELRDQLKREFGLYGVVVPHP